MNSLIARKTRNGNAMHWEAQSGSALVIALFVLALVGMFVALAMSRTASEAVAVGNETDELRTFYAAQGSLESMTRNFNKVFDVKLSPTSIDLDGVRNATVPELGAPAGEYTFVQEVQKTSDSTTAVLSGGPFSGLNALRDNWRLRTTATSQTGTQVQLTRNILNNRVPIFQFGVFYDDDLELFRPPLFSFGGRVHSNRHFFLSPGAEGVFFDSRVTAVGEIITQSWRNGFSGDMLNNQTFIKNASGVFKQLLPTEGSVLNGSPNIFASDPDLPSSKINPNWDAQSAKFDGNLVAHVAPLKLPLKIGSNGDLIEMIRRGKMPASGGSGGDLHSVGGIVIAVDNTNADSLILRAERFANKTGIRISLSDSKAKLPGCASGSGTLPVTGKCGVRLDGHINGLGSDPLSISAATDAGNLALAARGYLPKPMGAYQATRLNGDRLNTGGTREVWIKIETVQTDQATGNIITQDITEDILSLGVTEQAPSALALANYNSTPPSGGNLTNTSPQPPSVGTDSRSVVKLQRWTIPGPSIPNNNNVLSYNSGAGFNYVRRFSNANTVLIAAGCVNICSSDDVFPNGSVPDVERYGHLRLSGSSDAVVPFPIEMFDTREGAYFDLRSTTYYPNASWDNPSGTPRKLARNGVLSMIDIDIANLRRFLRGDFNGLFPTDTPFATTMGRGLLNSDIPDQNGWVVYVSDRRGDADFDGEFDMEDVYGNPPGNDGVLQPGEDVNRNGALDTLYGSESERYRSNTVYPDVAAVYDHIYYRRGVRLINGTTLPGIYDSSTPGNTRGFTFSSENGVYVSGNYNATGVVSVPSTGNTPFNEYLPFNTPTHIPASIVADAVTILSNSWNDARSFASPYDQGNRIASNTTARFGMISGDTIASRDGTPNQGGISPRLNGGVHNFPRFLERWSGRNLNYAGSLINLYNSRNNNGSFKCCNTVYNPPIRNWVFDSTFLDPTRLPPGTPFFQFVQTTGFQRTNN